jgi:endoglucanase
MPKLDFKFMKELLETPSPTGYEEPAAELVRERLADVADDIRTDTMGSVHATVYATAACDDAEASQDEQSQDIAKGGRAPKVMLSTHMDEIGLMVTYISPEGFLSVAAIGGVDAAILPGMRVDVHASDGSTLRGVVGRKPIHLIEPDERKNVTPLSGLVIDLGLPGKKVKKSVKVGDPITFGVGFERFGKKMAVSRAFDDKIGVYIACEVLKNLSEREDLGVDFTAAITVQEEIGTRGAITSAHSIHPDVAIAFDVTHATDYPGIDKTKYGEITCGMGPVIARGPNINPAVFDRLVAAAEAEGIKYQLEAEPSVTGTDARSIQITRGGIPTGLISVPLRYMHTPTEVISLDDVKGAIKLITRFVADLDADATFVPGMYEAPVFVKSELSDAKDDEGDSDHEDDDALDL